LAISILTCKGHGSRFVHKDDVVDLSIVALVVSEKRGRKKQMKGCQQLKA